LQQKCYCNTLLYNCLTWFGINSWSALLVFAANESEEVGRKMVSDKLWVSDYQPLQPSDMTYEYRPSRHNSDGMQACHAQL